jgi:hypothetical protein
MRQGSAANADNIINVLFGEVGAGVLHFVYILFLVSVSIQNFKYMKQSLHANFLGLTISPKRHSAAQ